MRMKKLRDHFWWVGSLDPELRVFDIVMYTAYGTTYNSFLLKGSEKNVLFEVTKASFSDTYIEALSELIDISDIDIVVLSHTEPDHTGALAKLLERNPDIEIYGTTGALNMIREIVNRDIKGIAVRDGDSLDIGGKTLQFILAPNLHWPDTMFTYIPEEKILVTCDAFGAHYAYENVVNDDQLDKEAYLKMALYYFDNIMGPFKSDVRKALDKIDGLDIGLIATGHGPVLTENPRFIVDLYREWASAPLPNEKKTVLIPYVTSYGYTEKLAKKMEEGLRAAGDIDVKLYDMVKTKREEIMGEVGRADGLLLGTPTVVGEALPPIWELAISLTAREHGGKFAGVFGSYGWSGEGVPHILERLKQVKMKIIGDGFRVRFNPTDEDLKAAFEYGKVFGTAVLTGNMPE